MSQLSHLSADLVAPRIGDVAGLLAAGARLAADGSGWTLTVTVDAAWRAHALLRELRVRDLDPQIRSGGGGWGLVTSPAAALAALAGQWEDAPSLGATSSVLPEGFVLGPGVLRCWALAAGSVDPPGYALGLDPTAPRRHDALAAACADAGIAAVRVGGMTAGPALRIVGRRRLDRLAGLVGTPPPEAPPGAFPAPPVPG